MPTTHTVEVGRGRELNSLQLGQWHCVYEKMSIKLKLRGGISKGIDLAPPYFLFCRAVEPPGRLSPRSQLGTSRGSFSNNTVDICGHALWLCSVAEDMEFGSPSGVHIAVDSRWLLGVGVHSFHRNLEKSR